MKPDFETVKVWKRAGEGKGFKNGRLRNGKKEKDIALEKYAIFY